MITRTARAAIARELGQLAMPSDGFVHHQKYLDIATQQDLLSAINGVIAHAPYYTPTMPRTGKPLSVRMTNCGTLGWLTDAAGGYRYEPVHPVTGVPWPPMPARLRDLWETLLPGAPAPEACLINRYEGSAKLGLHRDEDEDDKTTPVLSISLGDTAIFRVGGLRRRDPTTRISLGSGDVVILGRAARLAYHGVDRIAAGTSPLPGLDGRINLTLRRVTA